MPSYSQFFLREHQLESKYMKYFYFMVTLEKFFLVIARGKEKAYELYNSSLVDFNLV
jgi:hypothetical protein